MKKKPKKTKSQYAVPGLYFYDNKVLEYAKNVKTISRGDKEISTINQMYLDAGNLEVGIMTHGMSCFDNGTVESLDDATEFIRVIQNRQSAMIGCIEEVAYTHKFIGKDEIEAATEKYWKSEYGVYLNKLI